MQIRSITGGRLKLENLVDTKAPSYDDGYNPNFVQFIKHHWELDNRVGFINPNNVTDNSSINNGRINETNEQGRSDGCRDNYPINCTLQISSFQ